MTATPMSDDDAITAWGLVIEGFLATQQHVMGSVAERFGLAAAPFDILLRLLRTPGRQMPMTRLAREAALSSGGFTKVADRLERAGLLRREASRTDRRIVYVTLTPAGRAQAEAARVICAEAVRERVLRPLGPARSASLVSAMRMLREHNGAV
ncbi:MAG: MarR family winged helix-turn-helix transcriptional regulator [Candidatus Dormibacteraceae bacterium]